MSRCTAQPEPLKEGNGVQTLAGVIAFLRCKRVAKRFNTSYIFGPI